MSVIFPFLESLETYFDWHDFSYKWLSDCICQFLQDLVMHLVGSHRFVYVQVPHVVSNLISYNERDFIPSVPALMFMDLTDVWRVITSENRGEKMLRSSALSMLVFISSSVLFIGGVYLPFVSNVNVEAHLIFLPIPCQILLQLCVSFPDPMPTHSGSIPMLFPG